MRKTRHPAVSARNPSKNRRFFYQRVSFPMRDASPLELEKFWSRSAQDQSEINPDHHWDCAGPFNVAGRVTSLAIHPDDPNCWFAGSAAGGVWISTDAGASWSQTWSRSRWRGDQLAHGGWVG